MPSRGVNVQQTMYMIGHYNKFIHRYILVGIIKMKNCVFNNLTDGCKFLLREGAEALPYDFAKQLLFVSRTNSNKIRTVSAIIVSLKPCCFPDWKRHIHHLRFSLTVYHKSLPNTNAKTPSVKTDGVFLKSNP